MRSVRSLGLPSLLLAAFAASASAQSQVLAGAVYDHNSKPLAGIGVEFHDALNADVLSKSVTDLQGNFKNLDLPSGIYKVRFWDELGAAPPGYCIEPEYYGAGGLDSFCSAADVYLEPGGAVLIQQMLIPTTCAKTVATSAYVTGTVRSSSGHVLPGIVVDVLDADDAVLIARATTDAVGAYALDLIKLSASHMVVRFSDPADLYYPQFHGAAGTDDFCQAERLATGGKIFLDAELTLIPPAQATENLVQDIQALPLPTQVSNVLATPLTRATDLLTDGNPNNDGAVCHQLDSFITRVGIQEKKGQLTATEAADLIASANAIKLSMGCN